MMNHKNEIRMRTIPHETMRFKARISDSLTVAISCVRVLKDSAFNLNDWAEPARCRSGSFDGLAKADLPVVCIETRHTRLF